VVDSYFDVSIIFYFDDIIGDWWFGLFHEWKQNLANDIHYLSNIADNIHSFSYSLHVHRFDRLGTSHLDRELNPFDGRSRGCLAGASPSWI
jgi:hypothetical protein